MTYGRTCRINVRVNLYSLTSTETPESRASREFGNPATWPFFSDVGTGPRGLPGPWRLKQELRLLPTSRWGPSSSYVFF